MMDFRERVELYLGNYLAGYPVQDHADQMAQDIWDMDINGTTVGELIEKADRLVELDEDQTLPDSGSMVVTKCDRCGHEDRIDPYSFEVGRSNLLRAGFRRVKAKNNV